MESVLRYFRRPCRGSDLMLQRTGGLRHRLISNAPSGPLTASITNTRNVRLKSHRPTTHNPTSLDGSEPGGGLSLATLFAFSDPQSDNQLSGGKGDNDNDYGKDISYNGKLFEIRLAFGCGPGHGRGRSLRSAAAKRSAVSNQHTGALRLGAR